MPVPTGTSPFVEPYNVVYTPSSGSAVNIFGVESIELNSQTTRVKTKDNGVNRYVASHVVFYEDSFTITTNDFNALQQLRADTAGHGVLTFNYTAESQNIAANTLATQLVTINGVAFENNKSAIKSKAEGMYTITGTILGVSGGTDPVVFTAGS